MGPSHPPYVRLRRSIEPSAAAVWAANAHVVASRPLVLPRLRRRPCAAAVHARRRTPATSGPCGRRSYGAGERESVSVPVREQQLRPEETAETMVED